MSEDRCCTGGGGILVAFLAGGLIGAGLALLYAPVAGREAREKIGGLAGDLRKQAEGWTGDLRKQAEGWTGDLKNKVESFIEEEKSVIKAAYDAGREAMIKEKAKFETPG